MNVSFLFKLEARYEVWGYISDELPHLLKTVFELIHIRDRDYVPSTYALFYDMIIAGMIRLHRRRIKHMDLFAR